MEFRVPSFETIIEAHEIILELYGGLKGIPRPELIETAVRRPEFYMAYDGRCDVHLVAAVVLDTIACQHPFADGNKRTALLTMLLLYNLNGVKLSYTLHSNAEFEELVLWVARDEPEIKETRLKLKRLVTKFMTN